MQTLFIGQNLIELPFIASTSTYASELLQKGDVVEGTVVSTLDQRSGRGQRGNNWFSEPSQNLTFSVILKPVFLPINRQFDLNKAISLSVCDFIQTELNCNSSSKCKIKWPNDIYVNNKKLGGILIENILKGNQIAYSIVGIGLNINQENFHESLPNPTSLKLFTGIQYELQLLLKKLCLYIEKRYLRLKNNNTKNLNVDYLYLLYRYNLISEYEYNSNRILAKITDVSDSGKLILKNEEGTLLNCDFKEIRFVI